MSWCKCSSCRALIDSDADPDCFVEIGNQRRLVIEMILCASCREEFEKRMESERDSESRGGF